MKLFLPDWDDRVDPGFDFRSDRPTFERDPWRDDLYAHEVFTSTPCYDGMLVSRSALPDRGAKAKRIEAFGLRGLLRLPASMELMGDCGAFGYINDAMPTYTTAEILDFYVRSGVDYGVSVDHIVLPAHASNRLERYQLTIENAVDFLRLHRLARPMFTPVGAVQGWDAASYSAAARILSRAGYTMIAVGGLVRSRSDEILTIVEAVRDVVGRKVRLHLLGVARWKLLSDLVRLGVYSADTASPVRTAWTSATDNYLLNGRAYTAIRIPPSAPVAGMRLESGLVRGSGPLPASYRHLKELERDALAAVRRFAAQELALSETVESVLRYDEQFGRRTRASNRTTRAVRYAETLDARPWELCECAVCAAVGVEVIIFRGANRNRRRGFHNMLQLYRTVKRAENGMPSVLENIANVDVRRRRSPSAALS